MLLINLIRSDTYHRTRKMCSQIGTRTRDPSLVIRLLSRPSYASRLYIFYPDSDYIRTVTIYTPFYSFLCRNDDNRFGGVGSNTHFDYCTINEFYQNEPVKCSLVMCMMAFKVPSFTSHDRLDFLLTYIFMA